MKKILWCGGSHLGHSKKVIETLFSDHNNEYYITAAPMNKNWSKDGGRYFVEGSIIGDNAAEPERRLDLLDFDHIVFVGHYIQPQKYTFRSQPLSSALKKAILGRDDLFIRLPDGNYNEPITLFPEIAKGKCVLLCDPFALNNALPIDFMEEFKIELHNFCLKKGIDLMFQPQPTLDHNLSTLKSYSRSEGDQIHCNEDFWLLYLQSLKEKLIG